MAALEGVATRYLGALLCLLAIARSFNFGTTQVDPIPTLFGTVMISSR
jgi:hypothetical protein